MRAPFCGRCGQRFLGTDLRVEAPGQVVRHPVYCPTDPAVQRFIAWFNEARKQYLA